VQKEFIIATYLPEIYSCNKKQEEKKIIFITVVWGYTSVI